MSSEPAAPPRPRTAALGASFGPRIRTLSAAAGGEGSGTRCAATLLRAGRPFRLRSHVVGARGRR